MENKVLKLHPDDNVLVALRDLENGDDVSFQGVSITLREKIKAKHKFPIRRLSKGDTITMYGNLVGKASCAIECGEPLTVENTAHAVAKFSEKIDTVRWQAPDVSAYKNRTFDGYLRSDGQVGTANYWLVVPLVFCENRNVEVMKQAFVEELGLVKPNKYRDMVRKMVTLHQMGKTREIENLNVHSSDFKENIPFRNIDGVQFLTHQGGCGGVRQDSEMLCALIAGYLKNPNVAGATVLSLGCQNAQISLLRQKIEEIDPNFDKPLYILEQQQEGRESDLLTKAVKYTFKGLIEADKNRRIPAPLSNLTLGLECGGSDGFSGISANPVVGNVSDLVVALGGKAMLAEFPELCGVEQELINRCTDTDIAGKFIYLMRSYSDAAVAAGSGFDMNPSPGNIKDGLITDAMKSAGAAKKGGTSPITDVLDYGEYAKTAGLNLLCTPGNDVESTTALAGSGANLILFTTGLGTPTGNPVAPVVKISSNSELAIRMPDIIDMETGAVLRGEKSIAEMGVELLDFVIELASGKSKTKAQLLGQDDFIPWKRGVSL